MNQVLRPKPTEAMTESGRLVDLYQPDPETILIKDIAAGLSRINRFAGQTTVDYSVAEHSILVARILEHGKHDPRTCLYALLHDAHEAYLGDLIKPARAAIEAVGGDLRPLDVIKFRIDQAIRQAFGLPRNIPRLAHDAIKEADRRALMTEARDVMAELFLIPDHPEPAPFVIKPAGHPTKAETAFLETFERLGILVGLPDVGIDVDL